MFIFLTDLINVMSKHIGIFLKNKGGALSDDEWSHYRTVWGDIKEINKELPVFKRIKELIITTEPLEKTTTQKIKRFKELDKILK